jgi:hypothetical protein
MVQQRAWECSTTFPRRWSMVVTRCLLVSTQAKAEDHCGTGHSCGMVNAVARLVMPS